MSKKSGRFSVPIPQFSTKLTVSWGVDEVARVVKSLADSELTRDIVLSYIGIRHPGGMWIRYGDDLATLVHELHHCGRSISDHYELKSDEWEAYFIDWMVRECVKRFKARGIHPKLRDIAKDKKAEEKEKKIRRGK